MKNISVRQILGSIGVVAALCFMAVSPSRAQNETGSVVMPEIIQNCTKIPDDTVRLNCYDAAAGRKNKNGFMGSWLMDTKMNPLNNTQIIQATNEARVGIAPDGRYPILAVTCDAGKAAFYVQWYEQFKDDDPDVYDTRKTVLYKMGDSDVKQEMWDMSADRMVIFAPKPIAFLKELAPHKQFVVQVTADDMKSRTLSFDVSGTQAVAEAIEEACGTE